MRNETEFTVECLRVWYCMDYQTFKDVTGFNEAGGYAESKFSNMMRDMGMFICNCDNNTIQRLADYAKQKIADYDS